MPLTDAEANGLGAPDHVVMDLGKAEVLVKRTSPVDAPQMSALQAAALTQSIPQVAPAPPPVPPAESAIPIPAVSAAPTSEVYPPRVNDRIAKLYGQRKEAEENAARLEAQLAEQKRMLESLMQQRSPTPWSNQYGSSEPYPSTGFAPAQASPQPAGHPVTREEILALLGAERQAHAAAMQLQQAHTASRDDAVRDFPDVFQDPSLRSDAERIWAADPNLQRDPQGPYKAAAMARGLRMTEQRAAAAQAVAADVRKTAMAAIGPSVPEGSGQSITQQQRYEQAMARFAMTQDMADAVLARKIQLGLA